MFDIIKLVIAVTSRSHIDNYDAHIKLRIASKAYRVRTENININVIFNVTVEQRITIGCIKTIHRVCGVIHDLYKPTVMTDLGYSMIYEFLYDGKFHREHALMSSHSCPARIARHINGSMSLREYYVDGELHREDGPAIENFDYDKKNYYRKGLLHRGDGPAIIEHYHRVKQKPGANNNDIVEKYYIDGKLHRVDGPAVVEHTDYGKYVGYYINDELHREDGPAFISYYTNKSICEERYYMNGKLHRIGAPAIIHYDHNREIEYVIYYVNGEPV